MTDTPTPDDLTEKLKAAHHVLYHAGYGNEATAIARASERLENFADRIDELEAELREALTARLRANADLVMGSDSMGQEYTSIKCDDLIEAADRIDELETERNDTFKTLAAVLLTTGSVKVAESTIVKLSEVTVTRVPEPPYVIYGAYDR